MYDIPHFKAKDHQEVLSFMRDHPFATLIGVTVDGKPVATQVPVFIDERDGVTYLSGHLMRKSGHHLALEANPRALVLFTGAHAYVSASWYTDPKMASTWNYMTVQASGPVHFGGEEELRAILQRTTDHFEGSTDSPASMKYMDPDYIDRMLKAIVAFQVRVESLEHVFKLSQNRDEASQANIIAHLEKGSPEEVEVARAMRDGKYLSRKQV
jgi:transcriptional regulator